MTYGSSLFAMYYAQHGATPYVPRLPSAYQEAEYLWTDATNTYIDTGLKITADDVIECRVMFTGSNPNAAFIGDGNTKTDSNFAIWLAHDSASTAYNAEFSFGDGNSSTYKVVVPKNTLDVTQWHTYKAEAGTGKAYVDGELVGQASVKGYANAKKLVLFGSWRGSATNSLFIGRMGECRIWRSGELIRDYVPAFYWDYQSAGFYDMCTGDFHWGATSARIHSGPFLLDELAELALEVTPTSGNLTVSFYRLIFTYSDVGQYVDWGDGTVESTVGGNPLSHTYAQPGTYVVRLQSLAACSSIECAGLAATRVLRLKPGTTVIPHNLFYNCADVTMSDSVFGASGCTTLEDQAFRNASSLAITRLPQSATTIGTMAFQQTAVSISTIPASVWRIYSGAFRGCTGITSITFESAPAVLESDVFASCANLTDIYVPWDSSYPINANAPWGATNATVHYRSNLPPNDEVWYYADSKLTLYTDTGVVSHTFSNGKGVLKFASSVTTCEAWFRGRGDVRFVVVLPDTVTAIADQAFNGSYVLTWVGMPDGVASIGEEAFKECYSMHLPKLPSGLTALGQSAMDSCSNLTLTSLPAGLTTINDAAFLGCTKMTISTLPGGVTSVGAQAFRTCVAITQMELPASVTSVGDMAFVSCTGMTSFRFLGTPTSIGNQLFTYASSLTDIYVPWDSSDAINANAPWGATNATVHYNTTT